MALSVSTPVTLSTRKAWFSAPRKLLVEPPPEQRRRWHRLHRRRALQCRPLVRARGGGIRMPHGVIWRSHQYAKAAHPVALLRARRERPRRRNAEQRNELALFHSQSLPCFRPKDSARR
jgi:hypothetical protein